MSEAAPFELSMRRLIRAPRERVYDALISADALRLWMGPRGMAVTEMTVDPRVGGAWRMAMCSRDGSLFKVGGVYCELRRPDRVAYTWQWEEGPMVGVSTLIEIALSEQDGATLLEMRHSGFPSRPAQDAHARGWNGPFNKLTEMLDPRGSAATVTLYGVAPSSYTRTARLALAEKGVAYTLHECGPHGPEILAVNPLGNLPAFTDGDFALYETSAIVRYIDESFDGPALLPGSIAGRALCEQWTSAFKATFYDAMVVRYIRQYFFPSGGGAPDRAVIDAALAEIAPLLALLDRAYAATAWLAADSLSMADLFVMPVLAYLERMPEGPQLLGATPHVARALATMRARPSFLATEPTGRFA